MDAMLDAIHAIKNVDREETRAWIQQRATDEAREPIEVAKDLLARLQAPPEPEPTTAMTDASTTTTIVPFQPNGVVDVNAVIAYFKSLGELKTRLLDPKTDIVKIGGKDCIKRTGTRKMATAFIVSDRIIKDEREMVDGIETWRFWVEARAPNGRVSIGIGSCSSNEKKNMREHDVYATAHTRAKSRAILDLIGVGEVSAEEME